MRVSVLDLGSNSFRLLVADAGLGRTISPIARDREMLHLGAVVARHGCIPPAELERAEAAVKHLSDLAIRAGADHGHVVATSALRSASNGAEAAARLGRASGIEVTILGGEEEARLSFLGVRAAVALHSAKLAVLDLGGGSMELVVGDHSGVEWAASADIGVSRLHAELDLADRMDSGDVSRVRKVVNERLSPLLEGAARASRVVAVGGSVRALGHLVAKRTLHWLPPSLNQLPVTLDEVKQLRAELVPKTPSERIEAGVKASRADHIGVAAVVIERVLELLDSPGFELSDWGLREGLVIDTYAGDAISRGPSLRRREILRVRDAFTPDGPDHAALVARLGLELFDATQAIHRLEKIDRSILEFGLLLHDIGRTLAVKGYHRHGAYLLENAELRGFAPLEVALIVSLVRFSRTGVPKPGFAPFAALPADWVVRLERLLALTLVADAFDWARSSAISDIEVTVTGAGVNVKPLGDELSLRSEVVDAASMRFADVFGVPLTVDGVD